MDIVVEIGVGILGKIFEYTVAPVGRQVGYLFCYTSNVENLKTQVQELNGAIDSLQHRINEARRNVEVIETRVENWMSEAKSMLEKAEIFLNDEGHIKARLSCGSSPSLVSRHQLSRKAKKMTAQIADVKGLEKFSTISYRPEIENGIGLFKGYQAFETRKEVLMRVMEVLRDPNVKMVALYGMGGVGKTVLAKEVKRQSKEENIFSKMVITSVSQTVNKQNIQQEIADHLGLKFDHVKSEKGRADLLRDRLKQETKFLVVLDDIWDKIELFDIGIYFEEDQSGCKILLTSRIRDVVCNDMDVETSISVDPLLDYEAERLFRKIVGNIVEQPNFRDLVPPLVKECAGLPIAIVTVASALKKKSSKRIWENALQQLQSHNPENIEGMPKKVYSSIRLSYDFLDSEEAKSLLLLCSLHREDENIKIDDLVKCIAGWDLFEDIVTLKDTRDRIETLVDKLKSRCLLLDGDNHETMKMHDIIRDVSIWIAAKERNIYSLSDISKLENLLNKRKLKDSKAISVLDIDDFGRLPQKLECTHIELLLMHCNYQLGSAMRTIPEHFFEETKMLKVLVLKGSLEISLPLSSLHFLDNLRSLCLRGSKLEDVGLIGDLKNLNILDLSSTNIYQLPKEIGQLSCLQLLDLRRCENLKVIKPNVLSSLMRLEELYMAENFDKWEVEGVRTNRSNASLIELKNLRELTTLYLCVADIQMFPNDSLFNDKLQRYQIHIGNNKYYSDYSSSLVFIDCKRSQITAFGFRTLIRSLKRMSIIGLSKVKNNVFYDVDLEGFPELKRLELSDCDELQYVVNMRAPDSFSQLREVDVKKCGQLKNLFPSSIATRLDVIDVEECKTMEEIVGHNQRENELVFDVRYMRLYSLPKLVQFMIGRPQLGVTNASLISAESFNYPLFGEKVLLPKLEKLDLYDIHVKKLWLDKLPSTSNYIESLSELIIGECNILEYIASVDLAKCLLKLRNLNVRECKNLEVMFKKEGEDNGTSLLEELLLPQLQTLELDNLPNLKMLCGTIDKENMQLLGRQQPQFNGKTIMLPRLKKLYLRGLNFTKLWEDMHSLSNLTYLSLLECKNLKYALSSTMCKSLLQLEKLEIWDCEDMEEVVAITEEPAGSKANVSLLFPKLKSLTLTYLPKLKYFCKGDSVGFPLFSYLTISKCHELRIFIADSALNENQLEEMKFKQPLFSDKTIVFHSLKNLELSGLRITTLWEDTLSLSNLTYLSFSECKNLKYALSSTMCIISLLQLENLRIMNCEDMEEIVAITEETEGRKANVSLLFPKLKYLTLENLPKLKQFCKGDSVEFPFNEIHVEEMNMLANYEVAFPNLLCVRTDWNKLINDVFGRSQFPCCNLKELHVKYTAQDEPNSLSVFEMLHRYQNLEILELQGCFVNVQTNSSVLQSLSQTLISFHNLTILNVSECNDLTYLLDSLTARGLSQLKEMWISCCKQMTDIIIRDYKECETTEDDVLDFKRLENLVLYDFPNLKSFFSGNNTIMFPRLENLCVIKCPEMKSFSDGNITTTILTTIVTEIQGELWWMDIDCIKHNVKRERWDGDVNTTIRKLWEESPNSLIQQPLTDTDFAECSEKLVRKKKIKNTLIDLFSSVWSPLNQNKDGRNIGA